MERRATDTGTTAERRRYNRRSLTGEVSPPYYETFERIAVALEGIQRALESQPAPRAAGRKMPAPRSEDHSG